MVLEEKSHIETTGINFHFICCIWVQKVCVLRSRDRRKLEDLARRLELTLPPEAAWMSIPN